MDKNVNVLKHEVFESLIKDSLTEVLFTLDPKPIIFYTCVSTDPFIGSYNILYPQDEPIAKVLKRYEITKDMYRVVKHPDDVLFSIILDLN